MTKADRCLLGQRSAGADAEIATDQQALAALRSDALDTGAAIDYAVALARTAVAIRFTPGKAAPSAVFFRNACNPKIVNFESPNWSSSSTLRANRGPDSRLVAHTGFEPGVTAVRGRRPA
ncbi:MAG TPA: hypothetical protein VGQ46_17085 [Thermoanaerobaculia bacterium]|nr:hypothetical protein [Thermoanaerobaculia bacterium]